MLIVEPRQGLFQISIFDRVFSKNHVFVQKSRWPYSMQNKFGMDKIHGSHKLEWLYVLFPVRIYFTSSEKVTDYL